MKKFITPDNFITGMLVIALIFVIQALVITLNHGQWKSILGFIGIFPLAIMIGHFVNKLANKYIK